MKIDVFMRRTDKRSLHELDEIEFLISVQD